MSDYNVGDLVAEFLQAAGVDTVFGVVSVHNIPMMDGLGLAEPRPARSSW